MLKVLKMLQASRTRASASFWAASKVSFKNTAEMTLITANTIRVTYATKKILGQARGQSPDRKQVTPVQPRLTNQWLTLSSTGLALVGQLPAKVTCERRAVTSPTPVDKQESNLKQAFAP